jgi:hypothetical protein
MFAGWGEGSTAVIECQFWDDEGFGEVLRDMCGVGKNKQKKKNEIPRGCESLFYTKSSQSPFPLCLHVQLFTVALLPAVFFYTTQKVQASAVWYGMA